MTQEMIDRYVRSTLTLQGYSLAEADTSDVIEQFSRIQEIAATFVDEALPVHLDAAAVFRP